MENYHSTWGITKFNYGAINASYNKYFSYISATRRLKELLKQMMRNYTFEYSE